jgi:hypothetical protein
MRRDAPVADVKAIAAVITVDAIHFLGAVVGE